MVISVKGKALKHWRILRNNILKGLEYSYKVAPAHAKAQSISLDEELSYVVQTHGDKITAVDLLELIGEDTLKKLILNICNEKLVFNYETSIERTPVDDILLSRLIGSGFDWGDSPEGHRYWSMVSNKVIQFERRNMR